MKESIPESAPFAELFSQALAARGMTLSVLAERLADRGDPVSIATLSYWRSGGRHPREASIPIVEAIEHVLGCEPGLLVESALRDGRHLEEPVEEARLVGEERMAAYDDVARELGGEIDNLRAVMMTSRLVVDPGWRRGQLTQNVVARVTGHRPATHFLSFLAVLRGEEAPRLESVAGASLAKTVAHPGGEVWGFRFDLEDSVPPAGLVHYTTTFDVPLQEWVHGHVFRVAVREIALVLEFPRDDVPEWIEVVEGTGEDEIQRFVSISDRRRVVVSRQRFGPGTLALRWGND